MGRTKIEWTRNEDGTLGRNWNVTRGCSRASPGCEHCYAERIAERFCDAGAVTGNGIGALRQGKPGPFYTFAERGKGWTRKVELLPEMLSEPLRWRKPSRVFVCSTSDLFHEALSDEDIAAVFGVMAAAPQHTFQVLTKRAERMREWFEWLPRDPETVVEDLRQEALRAMDRIDFLPAGKGWPLPNVWLGVSVEDQKRADERIPHLLATPAAVRWVSYEPALGPVDFESYLEPRWDDVGRHAPGFGDAPRRVDWIVCGGESGPGARPFDLAWARSTIAQCREAGVACFVKQLGARIVGDPPTLRGHPDFYTVARWYLEGSTVYIPPIIGPLVGQRPLNAVAWGLHDRKGGDMREWPEELRVRQFPRIGCECHDPPHTRPECF